MQRWQGGRDVDWESLDGTHIIAVQCLHTSVRNEALMSTVLKRYRIPHTIGSLLVIRTWLRVSSLRLMWSRKPGLKSKRRRKEAPRTVQGAEVRKTPDYVVVSESLEGRSRTLM